MRKKKVTITEGRPVVWRRSKFPQTEYYFPHGESLYGNDGYYVRYRDVAEGNGYRTVLEGPFNSPEEAEDRAEEVREEYAEWNHGVGCLEPKKKCKRYGTLTKVQLERFTDTLKQNPKNQHECRWDEFVERKYRHGLSLWLDKIAREALERDKAYERRLANERHHPCG